MLLLFLIVSIEVCFGWKVLDSIIKSNENIISKDEYVIFANNSFQVNYETQSGYQQLHIIFDIANIIQDHKDYEEIQQVLIKVNGIKRELIRISDEFKEIHIEFEHQSKHIQLSFEFSQQMEIMIRNLNVFINECPQNCKFCLNGSCYQQEICEKLEYQDQCYEECPQGTVAERKKCINTSILIYKNIKAMTSVEEDKTFLQKINEKNYNQFSESQLFQMNFENEFDGTLEIIFRCYGEIYQHYNSFLLIKGNKIKETLFPFLDTYYNVQSYKYCPSRNNQTCREIKTQIKTSFNKLNTFNIESYTNNFQIPSYWNIYEIKALQNDIRQYICQKKNCEKCSYENICSQCQNGFVLYENNCIKQCPYYTINNNSNCQDIATEQNNFIVKLYSPFQDINQIFGFQTFNLQEQISFRYENGTTYIGGGLNDNWKMTTFSKQIYFEKHYQLRIMFNISIINSTSNTDCFFYSIDGITYSINKTTTYIDHKISHSKLILNMNLGCKISSYGRCIISNYYLMVMKCSPLCDRCNGPSDKHCQLFKQKINNFDYQLNICIDGYYKTNQGCERCSKGCKICQNFNQCIECNNNVEGKFYCQPYI